MAYPEIETSASVPELWALVRGPSQIDPADLADAIEKAAGERELDFRTRLLIRDSFNALIGIWGQERVDRRFSQSSLERIQSIQHEELGAPGFSTLIGRIMEKTDPTLLLQFLRELGITAATPARLEIGDSASLLLSDHLSRHTDDIDLVDEIPAVLRVQHELLEDLSKRYGLRLAHFQSHYLPNDWRARLRSLGQFGKLDVFLVDPLDIAVGKLFSRRSKDRDDLRVLMGRFEKGEFIDRLNTSAQKFCGDPGLRQNAADNWYVLFGENFPV